MIEALVEMQRRSEAAEAAPNAQQQPHAGGSRGRASGGLNDGPEKGNLKLPLIPDNGTVTGLQPKALTAR